MKGLLVLLAAFAVAQVAAQISVGYARLVGGSLNPGVVGDVYFVPYNSTHTTVWASITGITQLPNSLHPLHVHQYGDISLNTFTSAGAHYVGAGSTQHGCETTDIRHEGDMGNFVVTNGAISQTKTLDLLALTGSNSVIGKAVVLHNVTDNCSNATATGDAGSRLAAGVIGIANLTNVPSAVLALLGANTTNSAVSGDNSVTMAVAVLTPTAGNSVSGIVTFTQSGSTVVVSANVTGLPSTTSAYGFHIHAFGDINSTNGLSTGSHYNPYDMSHGIPPNATRHAGDMGNICTFDAAGNAYYNYTFVDLLTIINANNVIGRAVVVHGIRDNGGNNYGPRLAMGVIGVANPTTTVAFPANAVLSDPTCAAFAPSTTGSAASGATTAATTSSAVTGGSGTTTSSAPATLPALVLGSVASLVCLLSLI